MKPYEPSSNPNRMRKFGLPQPLDRRTRREADTTVVTVPEFLATHVPELLERHGHLVAEGMIALHIPPLTLDVEGATISFVVDADTGGFRVIDGVAPGSVVLPLSATRFSDLAQQQWSFNAMVVAGELPRAADIVHQASVWDSLWMTLLEGWPVVDDRLSFQDRDGDALDLHRSFTVDDDPIDIAYFLREAGFVHLRGWIDRDLVGQIAEDMDLALPHYVDGDGKSWWARLADGTETCVRMQEFLPHSPATVEMLSGERWSAMHSAIAGDDRVVRTPVEGRCIEALVKPLAVVAGPSDLSFHRDCHLGRHAYSCSGMTVGVSVTGSGADNGQLRVVAGSHRVAIPVAVAMTDPYLPVVPITTEPGDLTVHLSCTLHESTPPKVAPRKVMYGCGIALAPRPDDEPGRSPAGQGQSALREKVYKLTLDDNLGRTEES